METKSFPVLLIRHDKISKWGSSAGHTVEVLTKPVLHDDFSAYYFNFATEAERKAFGLALETEFEQDDSVVYHDENDIRRLNEALGLGLDI